MLKTFIPQFQFEKIDKLCDTFKGEYEKVCHKAQSIDEFVVIQNNLKGLSERFENLASMFQEIEQYNILIDEHRIKMPEKNKSKFKETQQLLFNTRKKMEEGLEAGEVEEMKFKRELIDTEIPRLNKQSLVLLESMQNPIFADPNTPIEEAVKVLEELSNSVNNMKERGKQLNQFQKFLELEESHFECVNDVFNDFGLKNKLWSGLKEWIELSADWVN